MIKTRSNIVLLAVNISNVVDFFKSYTSYGKVEVLVKTEDRLYGKKTTVTKAIEEMKMLSGGAFYLDVLNVFLKIQDEKASA